MSVALLSEITALLIVVAAGAAVGRHLWLLRCSYLSTGRVRWKSVLAVGAGVTAMVLYSVAIYDDLRDNIIDGVTLPVLTVRPLIILLLVVMAMSGERSEHG
jgi:hypothetical protein